MHLSTVIFLSFLVLGAFCLRPTSTRDSLYDSQGLDGIDSALTRDPDLDFKKGKSKYLIVKN